MPSLCFTTLKTNWPCQGAPGIRRHEDQSNDCTSVAVRSSVMFEEHWAFGSATKIKVAVAPQSNPCPKGELSQTKKGGGSV